MRINKFVAMTLTAIMLFQAPAYAKEPGIEANQTPYTDNVNVKIVNANPNESVSVRITDRDGEKDFFEMGYADENGIFEFSYINDKHCGDMYIDANVGRKKISGYYFKMGESMYAEFINAVKAQHLLQGTGAPDGDTIKTVFDKYDDKFSLEKSAFDTFSEAGQKAVYDIMANDTSFNGKINTMKDVVDAFYAAILVESYKEKTENFLSLLQVSPYRELVGTKEFAPVLVNSIDVSSNAAVKKAVSAVSADNTDSKKLFKDLEFEIFKTSVVDAGSWNDVKVMFELYKDLLGVDTSKAGMSDYKALIGTKCSAYAEYADEFNKQVLKEDNKKPISSSGGGSGGGFGSVAPKNPATDITGFQTKNEDAAEKLVFDDLKDAMWAIKAVTYVHEKGIISGVGDGRFEPNRYITRAEAAKIIALMLGKESRDSVPFEDVHEDDWFYPYVSGMYKRGIINGISKTEFAPHSFVTRQQMAVMVYNSVKNDTGEESVSDANIADRDLIAPWAVNAVNYLYSKKIISGRIGGLFCPDDNMTRAEAATIIYNVIK